MNNPAPQTNLTASSSAAKSIMQNNIPNSNKIRVIACGGAGINTCAVLENFRGIVERGTAPVEVCYVDTSEANFKPSMPESHRFVVRTKRALALENSMYGDGSGGNRAENVDEIRTSVGQILQRFEPGYLTIVVSSGSGATGSMVAPYIVNELLQREMLVVPFIIGDARQGHWIKNTLNSIASYERLAAGSGKALAGAYFENTHEKTMSEVDDEVMNMIIALAVMFSRQNEGIDSRDLFNALHFNKMTSYTPHLASLEFIIGDLDAEKAKDVMTAMTVSMDKDSNGVTALVPYAKQGVLPPDVGQDVRKMSPLHVVTRAYPFNSIADRLKTKLIELDREAQARNVTSTVLANIPTSSSGGGDFMVL